MLQGFTVPNKVAIAPSEVPTKLGCKGFEITDYFILVNDPEVTELCNNGELFHFLRTAMTI